MKSNRWHASYDCVMGLQQSWSNNISRLWLQLERWHKDRVMSIFRYATHPMLDGQMLLANKPINSSLKDFVVAAFALIPQESLDSFFSLKHLQEMLINFKIFIMLGI